MMPFMDPALLRILDANLNRAREGLRVIEDYARFALDDARLAQKAKSHRHALAAIARTLNPAELLAARDTAGDTGRTTKTAAELSRSTTEQVVRAEFARVGEALRVIAEFGKIANAQVAVEAETIRYKLYELEQGLLLRGPLLARFRAARLYVIVTAALCRNDWLFTAEAALQGGAGILQLREKGLPDGELLRRVLALRELTLRYGALLILNDRVDLARLAGADGVHVGQDDLPVAAARKIGGGGMLVGKSTHTIEQFDAALREEPDYIAVGPMFPSTTKPQDHIAGLETLRAAAGQSRSAGVELPLVAIGGIDTSNARSVMAAGATCVCICSAVLSTADPQGAAASLVIG